jgi:hypothetical protein
MGVEYFNNGSLTDEEKTAYNMSKQSYVSADDRVNVGGFEYDRDSSSVNSAVYHNHKTKETYVGNRGSVSAYDWLVSDAQIATGMEDSGSRFKEAVETTKRAHSKYGYKVKTAGHSLGGSLSNYTTEKLGDNEWYGGSTTFNQGVSSVGKGSILSNARRECRKRNPPAFCSKSTNLKQEGDYVSTNNALCSYITLGMTPKLCRKSDPFGNTKMYRSPNTKRRWVSRYTTLGRLAFNKPKHSLTQFNPDNAF